MKFEICAATDTGCLRKNNEDGFYLNKIGCYANEECCVYGKFNSPVFAFVNDGVGGTQAGEEATRLCIDTAYNEQIPYDDDDLISLTDKMNKKAVDLRKSVDTACTIAGILLNDDCLYCFNLGDSRVYSISHGFLNQLSTDDTLSGIAGEEAENKEPLLQYIGKADIMPHIESIAGVSTFLICTDGLTDLLSLDEIEDIINEDDIKQTVINLIDMAKQKGGYDNITLMIIKPIKEN